MDTNENMNNIIKETLSRNKVLEDRIKHILGISEELLSELTNRNNMLFKIRKICLDDKPKIADHFTQIKLVLME